MLSRRGLDTKELRGSALWPSDHGAYLRDALTKFGYTAKSPDRALFTLGHGLGLEDDHIFEAVKRGKIGKVFLGAYGAQEIEDFKAIAKTWIEARASAGKRNSASPPMTRKGWPGARTATELAPALQCRETAPNVGFTARSRCPFL